MNKTPHFASNTTVSIEKSQQEAMATLRRYGASRFGTMEEEGAAYLMFEFRKLMIQIKVPLPSEKEFSKTGTGRTRSATQVREAHSQAIRQRWRALVLAVKAKLEAVECGISTLEEEFLAFVMMPDGRKLADHLLPEIEKIAATGKMPRLLLGGPS